MIPSEVRSMRKAIWDSMLDADMNVRYWAELGRRYYKKDIRYKIFLAAMSSGTVATWGIWSEVQPLWKTLSAISAVVALALPIINWPKMIQSMGNVKQKWVDIKADCEILWVEVNSKKDQAVLKEEFKKIKKREATASQQETNLPKKDKLVDECCEEVLESRGLKSKQKGGILL